MTIGPCWPRIFMDGQGRKVAATVRGGSVFGADQPVSRACDKVRGLHPRRQLSSASGALPMPPCECDAWGNWYGRIGSSRVD